MDKTDTMRECCSGSALCIFNSVDLVCGLALTIYGIFIGTNDYAPEWLYIPVLIAGLLQILAALTSWCGASFRSFAPLLLLSSAFTVVLALAEFVLAIIIFTSGHRIDEFLEEHQRELKLSDDQLRGLEENKYLPAYILLGLVGMEVLRACCSSELQRAHYRYKYHYQNLGALNELNEQLLDVRKEQEIEQKYARLKHESRQKYQSPEQI